MKIIFYPIFFFSSPFLTAQSRIVGMYENYFGSNLELNSDSTFKYARHSDMYGSWTNGVWELRNDTVHFKWIPVYDTISVTNPFGEYKDSLILSLNKTSERVQPPDPHVLYGGGQNYYSYPRKLFYHRNKLYMLSKEGKLAKKKIRGIWRKKKFPPWYRKVEKFD